MKIFKNKEAKKKAKKDKNLIVKNGKDVRVYPKETLLVTKLKQVD